MFRFLAKSLKYFYSLRKTKKSLRKLFNSIHRPTIYSQAQILEQRADVIFFRANFFDTIRQARIFIRDKKCSYLIPIKKNKRSFMTQKTILKPYTQIPIFSFFKVSPLVAIKRKKTLYHALRSRNKLFALAPNWMLLDYRMMLGLLLRCPSNVKYYFRILKDLSAFIGAAKYY